MNLVGITVGCGGRFERMAQLAAREWTRRTGRTSLVLGAADMHARGLRSPHRLKFDLFRFVGPKVDAVAFFDADMVFLEDFDPAALIGDDGFAAVRDLHREPWIVADAARAGVRPQDYFNSGFFLVHRQRAPILDLASALTWYVETPFKDQTHLNAAANLLGIAVNHLPGRYNFHVDRRHTVSLAAVTGAHIHWLSDVPDDQLERYYSDQARDLFWRD